MKLLIIYENLMNNVKIVAKAPLHLQTLLGFCAILRCLSQQMITNLHQITKTYSNIRKVNDFCNKM